MSRPTLLLTLGDPNGIGPEVVLKAARLAADRARLVAVGSASVVRAQAEALGLGAVVEVTSVVETVPEGALAVLDPAPGRASEYAWGETSAAGGRQALQAIERAVALCLAGEADGLVTAPISKEATSAAGSPFPGHTEMLQSLCEARRGCQYLWRRWLAHGH